MSSVGFFFLYFYENTIFCHRYDLKNTFTRCSLGSSIYQKVEEQQTCPLAYAFATYAH